jgi:putative DNA primase/helicase
MADIDPSNSIQTMFDLAPDHRVHRIEVRADAIHIIATQAEDALLGSGAPLYVRSGGSSIVKPVVDQLPAAKGKITNVARLCDLTSDNLTDYLSRAAHWEKFSARKKAMAATDPPPWVAKTILGREGEWRFPIISGVITTPTLRPDCTILSKPGYDPQTRLLLISPPPMPTIPNDPNQDDALDALRLLEGLLVDFPFTSLASRAVALSALITPVVRGALAAVPLHASTAPTAGTGKSYITDIASCISAGEPAPVIAVAKGEEETEKRLAAALMSGQAIISIDNVNGRLGGDLLCQMIERPLVTPRMLGFSKLVKVENRACIFATGNNIQLVGDMTRRVIVCSLDCNMERPELRTFQGNPKEAVLADRGNYIAACLTIARAYAHAGYPGVLSPLASFEDWSRIVRSALVWLGCADPVDTMEAARDDDPETAGLRSVFACWHDAVGDAWRSAAQMKQVAEERIFESFSHPDLNQVLKEMASDRRGDIDAKSLGKFLGRYKGRVMNGLKLSCHGDKNANAKQWRISSI